MIKEMLSDKSFMSDLDQERASQGAAVDSRSG